MNKAIKITSLIGLILQSFLTLLFLLFFVLSITGILHPELTTSVNGETTVHDTETAQSTFSLVFGVLLFFALLSLLLGIFGLRKMKSNLKVSSVFYFIGAVISANLITFISWITCGVLLISTYKDKRKEHNNETYMVD
ncbi:hypothetical protein HMPREF2580_09075 [Staphylococcus sp. HMSC036D05]|uniref:DUF4064 domain-containing protein n=1 Tax=Staphylococcus sp. HMSC036D05 TaxID=1715059 RepID=UPI0008A95DA7|nr:DUF4064 domain-containing protein [Staphylococcus sp. HMSC036D05]OHO71462.1 hypothetical protein HMPREF2580_09075 [Staphylococcus sp. HMSC036D05]